MRAPIPGGDKEWYLYAARAGLLIGVASHRRDVSLNTIARREAPTSRPAPPPFSSIMARRRRWFVGLPEPCLLIGSTSELMGSQGVCALVDQLSLWLERAARLELIDPTQGWEPVRRDLIDDIIVADPGAMRAMVKATSGCAALWYFLTGAIDERRLHRIAVDDEPAVIASDLSTVFEGRRAQKCLTLVAWSGKPRPANPSLLASICRRTLQTSVACWRERKNLAVMSSWPRS